jgi:restriction endonuclease S subunit
MKKPLHQIAQIPTGIYQKEGSGGEIYYLQAKHFDENGTFRQETPLTKSLELDKRLEKHLLIEGDILLVAKGIANRACLYKEQIGQAVASSTFFVIRLQEQSLMPDYLLWLLNTQRYQKLLQGLSKGTQVQSLSKKALSSVQIPIPSMEEQQEIIKVAQQWLIEQRFMDNLKKSKDRYYEHLLLFLANGKCRKNA